MDANTVTPPSGFVLDEDQSTPPDGFVEDTPSTLESAGHAFVNNLPFGGQLAAGAESLPGVGTGKDYSSNLEDWNKQTALDKQAHPYSYDVGAIGGAIAPIFIPGVGEALKAAPITGNAVLGALSAAGNTDLTKNTGEALKQAAVGAGIGGATAGILGKLTPTPESLENSAANFANKSIAMPRGYLGKMAPEERLNLGKYLMKNNLVGIDKEKVIQNAEDLMDQYGHEIGTIGRKTGGLTVSPEDQFSTYDYLQSMADRFKDSAMKDGKAFYRDYSQAAQEIKNIPENATWNDLMELKGRMGQMAFNGKGEIKNAAAADAYFGVKDMLNGIAEQAKGNPNLPIQLKDALSHYTRLHPIVEGLQYALDDELRGGGGFMSTHPMRMIMGMPRSARLSLGAIATAFGHPFWGAAAALPDLMNPAVQSKIASGMAKGVAGMPASVPNGINQMVHDYLINEFQKRNTPDE